MGTLSYGTRGSSYFDRARQQQVFTALATVTAPVIYTTAAGTGGPLLWNNTGGGDRAVNAVILAVTCSVTVASTVAAALGITGGSGQTSAPGTTTAIDSQGCTFLGGAAPRCNLYRKGTPSAAGTFFLPLYELSTTALTAEPLTAEYIDLGGIFVVPPGSWLSVAASATASTAVCNIGLIWAEMPL